MKKKTIQARANTKKYSYDHVDDDHLEWAIHGRQDIQLATLRLFRIIRRHRQEQRKGQRKEPAVSSQMRKLSAVAFHFGALCF